MEHYTHDSLYVLPVKPSPNLPNITSVYLYPSLGFFEGTVVSAGRGTDFPFQTFGHPKISNQGFNYVPRSIEGASKYPKFKGDTCYGVDLRGVHKAFIIEDRKIHIDWLIFAWNQLEDEPKFFNNYFKLLAGSEHLRKQIEAGMSADSIRKTWDTDLNKFKELRKKYLLYPDYTY